MVDIIIGEEQTMADDRYITNTRIEHGRDVTSYYDRQTGLIFSIEAPHPPLRSVDELCAELGINPDDLITPITPD